MSGKFRVDPHRSYMVVCVIGVSCLVAVLVKRALLSGV